MKQRMWAVDIEGNGAAPPEIIELAIVEMDELEVTGRFKHWRFRPKADITPVVSKIHGIRNKDVVDAPPIEDVIDDIIMWLDDAPIVGHNVRVELDMLSPVLPGWKPAAAYDTLKIARRLLPNETRHGLERLGHNLGLEEATLKLVNGGSAHSAPYDAAMSAILLKHMLSPFPAAERDIILIDADITRVQQGSLL